MVKVSFYKDSNNLWYFNGMIVPPGILVMNNISSTEVEFKWVNKNLGNVFKSPILVTNILKENGIGYTDINELKTSVGDFFVDATQVVVDRVSVIENSLYSTLWIDYWQSDTPTGVTSGQTWYNNISDLKVFNNGVWGSNIPFSSFITYVKKYDHTTWVWTGSEMISTTTALSYASQSEAEIGSNTTKVMSPFSTVKSIIYQNNNLDISELTTTSKKIVGGINELVSTSLGKSNTGHTHSYLSLSGGTMIGGITNSTSINPLTTLSESWVGPSSDNGIYFKGSNIGIGSTIPTAKLHITNTGTTNSFLVEDDTSIDSSPFVITASGNTGIGTLIFNSTYPEKLLVDAGITTSVNVISSKGNYNNYLQTNIQNLSSGTTASSDIIATNDKGNETFNYIDMGINSSTFSNIGWTINGANDGYLYTSNGSLAIGTALNKDIIFFTSGTTTTNERMRITSTGNVLIGTSVNNGYKLNVSGSTRLIDVTGTTFTVYGGTSNQFLKANGSVDDNIYLTTSGATNTYATISNFTGHTNNILNPHQTTALQVGSYTTGQTDTLLLGKSNTGHTHTQYLNLSGGTLTGSLTGTSFTTSGGTSNQFLKADGSVDSSSYLTYSGLSNIVLQLDQTSPQTIINGRPNFNEGLQLGTGSTVGTYNEGKVYYNNNSKSIISEVGNTSIELGRQLCIRVYNNTGSIIPKGSACKIQSSTNGRIETSLAIASGYLLTPFTCSGGIVTITLNNHGYPNGTYCRVKISTNLTSFPAGYYPIVNVTFNTFQIIIGSGVVSGTATIILPQQVAGLAFETIQIGQYGSLLQNGILTGLISNSLNVGDIIYLSDTIPGGYVSSTVSLLPESRTNQIGYLIQSGTTNGQIVVRIVNENTNTSLTLIESNIVLGNSISTGIYDFSGIVVSQSDPTHKVDIPTVKGWIVKNTNEYSIIPWVESVMFPGQTGVTLTNLTSADFTYFLINYSGQIYQQTTFPTPQERRDNIFLGKVIHSNRSTILTINNTVDYDTSPMSALRDMFASIPIINDGITCYPNGANLTFNTTSGNLYGMGINWSNNQKNPNQVAINSYIPRTFSYRTQLGGTSGVVSNIGPSVYDLNGVITTVPGNNNRTTNQRIFMYATGVVNIQYGQQYYDSLALAIAGQQTEIFKKTATTQGAAVLIGILAVRRTTTDLSNSSYAVFTPASIFGESVGGVNGISTTSLQQAYNNSIIPQILTNSTLDGFEIRRGSNDDTDLVFKTSNGDGVITSKIDGNGIVTSNSFVKSGGTSSQFLKADGSIDSNVYVTSSYGLKLGYIEKSSNYTGTTSDYTINCTGGTFYVTLPTAVGVTGQIYNIKNTSTGTITVNTTSSQTIDDELTQRIIKPTNMQVQSTGQNWIII